MNPPSPTAVARRPATAIDVVRSHIESPAFLEQLKMAMPRGEDGKRLVRGAITAIQKNPTIAECSQPSLFSSLLTCAQLGLHLDGREAHLVPFGGEVTLIPDYKGICRLVLESGKVSYIHADVVCENDLFEYDRGQIAVHKIDFRKDRGQVYAVYALARFKDGSEKSEVMGRSDVEKIRMRSRQPNAGMWKNDWNEGAKKTVFKRLSKWLPLSPEAMAVIEQDNEEYTTETTVSAPPSPEPRPRGRPRKVLTEAQVTETPPPVEEDDIPFESPAPAAGQVTETVAIPATTPTPAPVRKPAKVLTPDQQAVSDWAAKHTITFDEVVVALIEYGEMPETARRGGWHDLLEKEVKFILTNHANIATAIVTGRG